MTNIMNNNAMIKAGIITLIGIFILTSICCKSPEDESSLANIDVSNECGVALDIFMDGVFQFVLEYQAVNTIANVTLGVHDFVAKKKDTDFVVVAENFDIYSGGELTWTIKSPATIRVTNAYGQTISIYVNAEYQLDLEDEEVVSFEDVLYGEYQFDALRTSDNALVDSKYFNVVENQQYVWLISD
ncbi:hypothetical protein ACFLT2_13900 [Acidobacteriota bacterium]